MKDESRSSALLFMVFICFGLPFLASPGSPTGYKIAVVFLVLLAWLFVLADE